MPTRETLSNHPDTSIHVMTVAVLTVKHTRAGKNHGSSHNIASISKSKRAGLLVCKGVPCVQQILSTYTQDYWVQSKPIAISKS